MCRGGGVTDNIINEEEADDFEDYEFTGSDKLN